MREKAKERALFLLRNKVTIVAALVIILYTAAGFFALPFLIGRYAPGILGERLQSDVSVEKISINPYSLALEIQGLAIKDPTGGPLVGFERLHVNFQLSSLFRWALTFRDIVLERPYLNVVLDGEGNLNLRRLAGPEKEEAPESGSEVEENVTSPLRMVLFNVEINEARIDVTDKRQDVPATTSFHPLTVHLADISTIPDREGGYSLTATAADGATFDWTGNLILHPFRSEGELAFRNISMETPWAFNRSMLNIMPPGGEVSLETHYKVDLGMDETVAVLDDLRLFASGLDLQLEEADRPFLWQTDIALGVERFDVTDRKVEGLTLAIEGGAVEVVSDPEGIFNFQKIVRTDAKEADTTSSDNDSDPGDPWNIDIADVELAEISLLFRDESMMPARVFSVEGINLNFSADVVATVPLLEVCVNDASLVLSGIEAGFGKAERPTLQVNSITAQGGSLDLANRSAFLSRLAVKDGTVDVIRHDDESLNLTLLFDTAGFAGNGPHGSVRTEGGDLWSLFLEDLELTGFNVHFTDETVRRGAAVTDLEDITLSMSRFDGKSPFPFEASMEVKQGGVLKVSGTIDPAVTSVDSRVTLEKLALDPIQPYLARVADLTLKSGRLSTAGSFVVSEKRSVNYRGQLEIMNLDVVENSTGETLLGWTRLRTPDLRFGLNPDGVEMDRMILFEPKGKLIIAEDGTVNVVEAFRREDKTVDPKPTDRTSEKGKDPFPVKIGRVTLDKGTLQFADFSLTPRFHTLIHELKGTVAGISSLPGTRSRVDLDGRVDRYGTSTIGGEINFFDPREYIDISMIFKNLEMTNFTPYSGKFAGRKINAGRLSLDLKYLVEDSRLQSHNKVVIEKLVLGDRVESPDAVSLPLGLAVALLKDADGVINIGLPVTGNLDDPEFHIGQVIWRAFVNLLTRMVSSPFRALASLLGAGEETLNEVLFDPGSSSIPPAEQEKLDLLLEGLKKRPELKLIVTGRCYQEADGRVLRTLQVKKSILKASGVEPAPGEDPGPVDFGDAAVREVLKALVVERYGNEEYERIKAEMVSLPENGDDEAEEREEVQIDPAVLARGLFEFLVEQEPIGQERLLTLADERARAVAAYMTGDQGLEPERVSVSESVYIEKGDSISVTLDLGTMTDE